jgi:hypothetical protein
MAEEVSEAFKLSYGLLAADATLSALVGARIYQAQAPQGLTDLYILGDAVPGADVWGVGGVRLLSDFLIRWRVVRKGQVSADQRSADARMDAVLTAVRARISGNYIFSIVRERPYSADTRDDANNTYAERGGLYRHFARPRPA